MLYQEWVVAYTHLSLHGHDIKVSKCFFFCCRKIQNCIKLKYTSKGNISPPQKEQVISIIGLFAIPYTGQSNQMTSAGINEAQNFDNFQQNKSFFYFENFSFVIVANNIKCCQYNGQKKKEIPKFHLTNTYKNDLCIYGQLGVYM